MRVTLLLAFATLLLTSRAEAAPDVSLPASDVIAGPWKLIAVAPDGSWVAFTAIGGIGDPEAVADSGRIQVWNLKTGALDRTFAAPGTGRTEQVPVISPDGKWLAYTRHADKGEVRIYDFRTGKRERIIRDLGEENLVVGFSADSKEVLTAAFPGNNGKRLVAWAVADGKSREITIPKHERVTISPDGKTAVVEVRRGDSQELWDLATGKKLAGLGRESIYRTPQFLRGGKDVAMLYNYSTPGPSYRVWEVGAEKKPTPVKIPGKSKDPIHFALTDDLSAIAVLEYYGDLRVFDAGKDEPRFTFPLKAPHGEGLTFTPDGKRLIIIHPFERAWVLDATTGKPEFALDPDYRSVRGSRLPRTASRSSRD